MPRAQYERLLADDADDTWIAERLAELARDRGGPRVGGWAYLRSRGARPTSARAAVVLAGVLRDLGDVTGAIATLDGALKVAPDDPTLLEESGRTLVERGGEASARGRGRLRRALALHPQNPDLRRYMAEIAPAPGDDLEKQYARRCPS